MAGTLPETTGDASRQPRSTAFLPEHIRVVGRMTRPPEQRPAHDTIDNIADWLLGSPRQLSDGIASFAWHLTQARPERRHSAGGYGSESRPWAKFQTGLHRVAVKRGRGIMSLRINAEVPDSAPKRPKETSVSTTGSAMGGRSCSPIRRISRRSAQPNSAIWRG